MKSLTLSVFHICALCDRNLMIHLERRNDEITLRFLVFYKKGGERLA